MAYRAIKDDFWQNPKQRSLTNNERALYLFCATHTHTNQSGICRLDKGLMQFELSINEDTLNKSMEGLISKGYLIVDEQAEEYSLTDWNFNNYQTSTNNFTNACKFLSNAKSLMLLDYFVKSIPKEDHTDYFATEYNNGKVRTSNAELFYKATGLNSIYDDSNELIFLIDQDSNLIDDEYIKNAPYPFTPIKAKKYQYFNPLRTPLKPSCKDVRTHNQNHNHNPNPQPEPNQNTNINVEEETEPLERECKEKTFIADNANNIYGNAIKSHQKYLNDINKDASNEELQQINDWLTIDGLQDDLIVELINRTVANDQATFKGLEQLIDICRKEQITNLQELNNLQRRST